MLGYKERSNNNGKPLKNIAEFSAGIGVGISTGYIVGRFAGERLRRSRDLKQDKNLPNSVDRIKQYYNDEIDSYLKGSLQGTCHFGYTGEGESFESNNALHNMEVLLGKILSLPPGSTVVDAGCGYGRVAKTMASEFGLNVIGYDLVPHRIEEARRFIKEHGVADKVKVYKGDYTKLPLPDNSVDAVYTMETLCHADPLEAAQKEFMRVLKPGGKVVHFEYEVPPFNSMNPVNRRIAKNLSHRTGMASISRFTHGAFRSLIESAGFENIHVEEISRNVYPTWHWMFQKAIKEKLPTMIPELLNGKFIEENTNLAAALIIWPYRHNLRYIIGSATKPVALAQIKN